MKIFDSFPRSCEGTSEKCSPIPYKGAAPCKAVCENAEVQPGDRVQVTGTVKEYYDLTELSPVAGVTVIGAGNPMPSAAAGSLPVSARSDWEKYEGMLVEFSQTLYVTDHYDLGRYGEVALSAGDRLCQATHSAQPGNGANEAAEDNERNRIVLDDANPKARPPAMGPTRTNTTSMAPTKAPASKPQKPF